MTCCPTPAPQTRPAKHHDRKPEGKLCRPARGLHIAGGPGAQDSSWAWMPTQSQAPSSSIPPGQRRTRLLDSRHLSGGDKSAYVQDDWTTGRTLIDYGARFDVHQADVTTSQLSPRLNVTYTAGPNKFHAYYDRLFQPIAVEDVIQLGIAGRRSRHFQPERDDFFRSRVHASDRRHDTVLRWLLPGRKEHQ